MASNLALFPFTNLSNTAISTNDGWFVLSDEVVYARAGNDTIIGAGDDGIANYCIINTEKGNDLITGVGAGSEGSGVVNLKIVTTGAGTDTITGIGYIYGVFNPGLIDTGNGDDTIIGVGSSAGIGNSGTITTGGGNYTISGIGSDYGILNAKLEFTTTGLIDTGNGDDTIIGVGSSAGISNSGTITTRGGRDTVDALQGGFQGNGRILLGNLNDTLKGFGTGTFKGGTGIDKILFGQGSYTVTGSTIVSGGVSMNVFQFEKIGGANGGLFNFRNGTLNVDNDGVATFAA